VTVEEAARVMGKWVDASRSALADCDVTVELAGPLQWLEERITVVMVIMMSEDRLVRAIVDSRGGHTRCREVFGGSFTVNVVDMSTPTAIRAVLHDSFLWIAS
jgi:hypothetical protein